MRVRLNGLTIDELMNRHRSAVKRVSLVNVRWFDLMLLLLLLSRLTFVL